MASPEERGRISVSRDALRAELATLKLDLIQTLASRGDVEALAKRQDRFEERLSTLERHDGNREAVRENTDAVFSKREKKIGVVLASLAIVLQGLVLSGVFH